MLNKLLLNLTIILIFVFLPFIVSSTFTIINNCPFTIWPGTLSGSGTPPLSTTGFQLDSGKSVRLSAGPGWSGRIWARTDCQFDRTGTGKCVTGDCGGRLECDGSGATPPASLFEITLGKGNTKDFYDVSLVDGYNLPLVVWPTEFNGAPCNATGCVSDLNMGCPKELQVLAEDGGGGGVVACKSACEAFGEDQYCCSGQFGNPTTCRPTYYSTVFKRACPRAYSYAYDDGTSTFTCKANNYVILFCPKAAAVKNKPNSGTAMSPPNVPYNSSTYSSPPTGGSTLSTPPTGGSTLSPPPTGGTTMTPGTGGTTMSPPTASVPYESPPTASVTYESPPSGDTTLSPPSFTYDSPPTGNETPPSLTDNSAPPFRNDAESGGEISSSYGVLPYPVYILPSFYSLLLWS